jgi:hypothetical protein
LQDLVFLQQFKGAVQNEIIRRGGPAVDMNVDLTVDVVSWGSRLASQPDVPRHEAVWQATVIVGDKTMSFREPFYIFESDVRLYAHRPPSPPSAAEDLGRTARPIRYTTN